MGKRAIVIIISFISAFILMSGGYGIWQKPLIITGSIEIRELPPPPVMNVAPINPEILDKNEKIVVDTELPGNPEESIGIDPIERGRVETDDSKSGGNEEIGSKEVKEAIDNLKSTDYGLIEQPIDIPAAEDF